MFAKPMLLLAAVVLVVPLLGWLAGSEQPRPATPMNVHVVENADPQVSMFYNKIVGGYDVSLFHINGQCVAVFTYNRGSGAANVPCPWDTK